MIKLQVFGLATLLQRDPNAGVFLWILQTSTAPISKNICERLLLTVVIYCIKNWIKLFRNQIGLSFLLKYKIKLFYLLSFVFIRFITRCHFLLLAVIRCRSLSLAVTLCHSFHCTNRCHSLSLDVPLACLFINHLYLKTSSINEIKSINLFLVCLLTIMKKDYILLLWKKYFRFQEAWLLNNLFPKT